jgi:hypothetical protein
MRTSFRFPLQSSIARREVVWGGILLLLPGVGWILNMGHRIAMVHNMIGGRSAWPAWRGYGGLFKHGLVTLGGMIYYYLPGAVAWLIGSRTGSAALEVAGAGLIIVATLAIPGYMTHYCRNFDPREIYSPLRALSRALQGGWDYWRAWGITLAALAISFIGLLALGVGFLVTSVAPKRCWQEVGSR